MQVQLAFLDLLHVHMLMQLFDQLSGFYIHLFISNNKQPSLVHVR